jgi:hypothetical protein
MTQTSRRTLIKAAAAGSVAAALQAQHHQSISGPLANTTVTFGEWRTDPALDRFAPFTPDTNMHHILPNEITIKAGGAVNFIISGLHLILVYDDDTQPGAINRRMSYRACRRSSTILRTEYTGGLIRGPYRSIAWKPCTSRSGAGTS